MASKKQNFEELIYRVNNLLKQEDAYPRYTQGILEGTNDYKISQVFAKKIFETDWIDVIEDCAMSLDNIVRNPRKFIVIEEDIVDISLARSISQESVKHLAQHTQYISSVTKDGMVIPSKILNTSKEESYEIYENRFVYTLILKVKDFINLRFDAIKAAIGQSGDIAVQIDSNFKVDGAKMRYKLDATAGIPLDKVVTGDTKLTNTERILRLQQIINGFLSSPFAKQMVHSARVRPPIQRTNVILKNPDFKKALVLWQYIETAEKMKYEIDTVTETSELSPSLAEKYRSLIFLNTILMESLAEQRDSGASLEEMLDKENKVADEYVTKNIDDYVPDDFPELKMELSEVRRIYYKIPNVKSLQSIEIEKINAALDRVIRQHRINNAKSEGALQKRLLKEQEQELAQARRLLKKEKLLEEKRKKEEEERTKREFLKAEEQRIKEEQERELAEKIAKETAERERIAKEEEIRLALELEAERQALIAKERQLAVDLIFRKQKATRDIIENEAMRLLGRDYQNRLYIAENASMRKRGAIFLAHYRRMRLVWDRMKLSMADNERAKVEAQFWSDFAFSDELVFGKNGGDEKEMADFEAYLVEEDKKIINPLELPKGVVPNITHEDMVTITEEENVNENILDEIIIESNVKDAAPIIVEGIEFNETEKSSVKEETETVDLSDPLFEVVDQTVKVPKKSTKKEKKPVKTEEIKVEPLIDNVIKFDETEAYEENQKDILFEISLDNPISYIESAMANTGQKFEMKHARPVEVDIFGEPVELDPDIIKEHNEKIKNKVKKPTDQDTSENNIQSEISNNSENTENASEALVEDGSTDNSDNNSADIFSEQLEKNNIETVSGLSVDDFIIEDNNK